MMTPEQEAALHQLGNSIGGSILNSGVLAWLLIESGLVSREAIAKHILEFLQANDPKAEDSLYEPTRRLLQMIQIDKFEQLH